MSAAVADVKHSLVLGRLCGWPSARLGKYLCDPRRHHWLCQAIRPSAFSLERCGRRGVGVWRFVRQRLAYLFAGHALDGDEFLHETASLGSPGLENIQWKKPVYPNDTLRLQTTVLETKPMGRRPDVGMTRNLWEMFNQHGDKVLNMEGWGMFRRRHPATPESA